MSAARTMRHLALVLGDQLNHDSAAFGFGHLALLAGAEPLGSTTGT